MIRWLTICITLVLSATAFGALPKLAVTTDVASTEVAPGQGTVIALTIDVPAGVHAQSNTPLDKSLIPLTVKLDAGQPVSSAAPVFPSPTIENYPLLGEVSVFTGQFIVYLPIRVPANASGSLTLTGVVRSQICNDSSCFPPGKTPFSVTIPIGMNGTSKIGTPPFEKVDPKLLDAAPATIKYKSTISSTTQAFAIPLSTSVPSTGPTTQTIVLPTKSSPPPAGGFADFIGKIGLALLVGIIFNVMPCVLPVLPLKAVGFYESAGHARSRTLMFGIAFAAGMIGLFALLAGVILLSKQVLGHQFQWGQQFANPWFVWTMAVIVGGLGFGMLGLFAVRLPTGVYGLNFRHDTIGGNVMWGALTAVLSTPCTAPLFPPLLAWAIAEPIAEGFTAIVAVGVGMSLPYIALSAFPQIARKFPRTGPFAELFKQMLGFLLLGAAAFFVGIRLVRDPHQWWLVFGVAIAAAIFLVVRTRQLMPSTKAIAIASIGALLITSIALGSTLRLTAAPPVAWMPYTADSLDAARAGDSPVLVEFSASWCLNCKYIEQTVYHDPAVLAALQQHRVKMISVDLTDDDAPGWTLLRDLGAGGGGIPFTAIYPAKSDQPVKLESIYTSAQLLAKLSEATR